MKCQLCRKPAEMVYMVGSAEKEIPLCGSCFGKWSPRKLDGLLGVRQKDYGTEPKETT